jgi:hypothetical protein
MTILHHDSVQLYSTPDELGQAWSRPGSSGNTPTLEALGRGGAASITPVRSGAGVVVKEFDGRQTVGVHASVRLGGDPSDTYGNALIVAGSRARLSSFEASSYSYSSQYPSKVSDLLTIGIDGNGALLVEHVVQYSSGAYSLNRLVLGGSSAPLVRDQLYSIEALIDVSTSDARVAVWLDGVSIVDSSFPRDRVSGVDDVRTDIIEYMGFGGASTSSPSYSDIVIYDAAELPAPLGPLSVRHYPLDDAAFGLPVDDSTSVEISKDGIDLSLPASFPGSGPLLGAYFAARTMSAEAEEIYSTMYTLTGAPYGDLILTDDGLPGGNKSTRRHALEGVVDFGDLNGLMINARST